MKELIENLTQLYDQRFDLLKKAPGPKLNYLSITIPEEILLAAGIIPYRLDGKAVRNSSQASALMHSNICPYVLSSFEEELNGYHEFCQGTLFVDTCDAEKRLYDVMKFYRNPEFIHMMHFPRVMNSISRKYLKVQFKQLIEHVEKSFGVSVTGDALCEAITTGNKTRELLQQISQARASGKVLITTTEMIRIVKSAMTGLKEEFNDRAEKLVQAIQAACPTKMVQSQYRVLLYGSYFDHTYISEVYESYGAQIVCEAISNGLDYYDGMIETDKDPIDALVDFYARKVYSAKMMDLQTRCERLLGLIDRFQIQSVLYFNLKFCDNYAIDFPYIKEQLGRKKIPVLMVEAERSEEVFEQVKTRISAFLESKLFN